MINMINKRGTLIAVLVIFVTTLCGCIENDIPYPTIKAGFVSMVADDQFASANIDSDNQTVTLNLAEDVDLSNVQISSYSVTEGATLSENILGGVDLNDKLDVIVSLYQDYLWSIKANQPIERYFSVVGQIGSSTIDPVSHTVLAKVPSSFNTRYLRVEKIKLGPADITTMSPDIEGELVDFRNPIVVYVNYNGISERWIIEIESVDVTVTTDDVDAWTNVIWAYGTAQADKDSGFEYKASDASDWTPVPSNQVEDISGELKCYIKNLAANTEYLVRAYSDEEYGDEISVTTSGYIEIPNASFDNWWKDGAVWNPWSEDGTSYWDTGNKGASTLGSSNSIPSDETWNGEAGQSAELQSRFVGIGIIGKPAAGSIYTGEFVKVDGTNGILNFGREFNGRPTKLKGYFKYTSSAIDYSTTGYEYMMGQPDTASIYMALTDWSAPYEIRTNPSNQQLFDKDSDSVIAYGEVTYGYSVDNFTEFEIELDYRDTNRIPSYVVIVAAASKYGDFFTVGSGSTLWVDNFWLEWDY